MDKTARDQQKTFSERAVGVIAEKPPNEKRLIYKVDVTRLRICQMIWAARIGSLIYFKYGRHRKLYEVYQSRIVYAESMRHCCLKNDEIWVGLSQVANIHFSDDTNLSKFWVGDYPSVEKFHDLLMNDIDCCVMYERGNPQSWYYDGKKEPIKMLVKAYDTLEFEKHLESIRTGREETLSKMQKARRGFRW